MSRYFNTRRTLALILVSLMVLASGCKKTGDIQPAQKHPLWKVSSGERSIYLLGSVHVLKHEDYPMDPVIEDAFINSDGLVLELDFAEKSAIGTQKLMMDKIMLKDEDTLRDVLPQTTYTELSVFFKQRNLDIERAQRYKPWFLATMITVSELERLGFRPEYGVDLHYYTKAKTMGKDILALETMQYQLSLFDSLSMQMQNEFILQSMAEAATLEKEFGRMVEGWKRGDMKALDAVLEPCAEYPDICRKIIDERNMNWLPVLEGFIRDGKSCLVIVGAGHMAGDAGLLKLLQDKGYRVEQL